MTVDRNDVEIDKFGEWMTMFENRVHGAFYYPLSLDVDARAGLYEIKVDDKVVYLGSTRNLKRRLGGYQANGSHLALKLARSLDENKKICVRWAYTDYGHRHIEKDLLKRLVYKWNRRV